MIQLRYPCPDCGKENAFVNQCRCDPNNLPTRPVTAPAVVGQRLVVANNMHVFRIQVDGHVEEEAAFIATTREEAERKFRVWLATEPYVREVA